MELGPRVPQKKSKKKKLTQQFLLLSGFFSRSSSNQAFDDEAHHRGGSLSLCLISSLSWSKPHIKAHEVVVHFLGLVLQVLIRMRRWRMCWVQDEVMAGLLGLVLLVRN